MRLIKKCPVFVLLVSTGLLLTLAALGGKNNIYSTQDYNAFKNPLFSIVFAGINEGAYPWQLFWNRGEAAMADNIITEDATTVDEGAEGPADEPPSNVLSPAEEPTPSPLPAMTPQPAASPQPEEEQAFERLSPLRESTRDEYLNHISADIYGDAGVKRAAEYSFAAVDESYFDDALFIGDSRTVGLHDYTNLPEHADFYCETSLTVYKVMDQNFSKLGTVEEALSAKDYGKIYLMVGINELGRGTTEDFIAKYTEVVDTLRELEPEALLFIQGIMRVSGTKNSSDPIFNNNNINARNNAIATLADNKNIFYIDVNEAVCDEEGNLTADYTFDQIHLLGIYNDLWKQFLMTHAVNDTIESE